MRLKNVLLEMAVVAGEYRVALLALHRLRDHMGSDPNLARSVNVRRSMLKITLERLEKTYTVRAFALFEAVLRELWKNAFARRTEPPVRDLIEGVAAASKLIPYDLIRKTHEIRAYRNSIVHLNTDAPHHYTLDQGVDALRQFLSYMPRQW
jgi:hypothetical protein